MTIRRGNPNGPFVRSFNPKNGSKAGTVRIGVQQERWVDEVCNIHSPSRFTTYVWQYNRNDSTSPILRWSGKNGIKSCKLSALGGEEIAKYEAPNYDTLNASMQVARLKVNHVISLYADQKIYRDLHQGSSYTAHV